MVKVREVYRYTANNDRYSEVLLPARNNNQVGSIRTAVTNNVHDLYNKSSAKKSVGKVLYNAFKNVFTDYPIIFNVDYCLFFDDEAGSYISFNIVYKSKDGYIDKNKTFVAKAIGSGGIYAGKDVTVTLKTDNSTADREVIFEYER
jgi:hypothetical protein